MNNTEIKTASEITDTAAIETKAVETKPVAKKTNTKKATAKKSETKKSVAKKEEKKPTITIKDVEHLYEKLGLKFNSDIKGNYRPMRLKGERGGSSLNLYHNGVAIFSTEDDAKAVEDACIEGVTVSNDNNSDKSRAWSVKFSDFNLLETVLAVYAKNPLNCISVSE